MKLFAIISLLLVAGLSPLHAQKILGEAGTTWPGIRFQVVEVASIPGNRLIVAVRVFATAQAPKNGTLIGTQLPIPPGASQADIDSGKYNPQPFSLESAVMIDEKTKQEYPALKPNPNESYLPGECMTTLMPSQAERIAVQFTAPPPVFDSEGRPVKQTVSIILPKANGPIVRIPIPLPTPAPAGVAH